MTPKGVEGQVWHKFVLPTVVLMHRQRRSRVWKGKKMPGRLGNERMTFKNIWLWKVRGSIEGFRQGRARIW